MIIKIGDKKHNTELSQEPVMCVFRQDELWNILMSLLHNKKMSRFAILPFDWDDKKKKEWVESVPVPETPEIIKQTIQKLKDKLLDSIQKEGLLQAIQMDKKEGE